MPNGIKILRLITFQSLNISPICILHFYNGNVIRISAILGYHKTTTIAKAGEDMGEKEPYTQLVGL
jgi:hypothetical protein